MSDQVLDKLVEAVEQHYDGDDPPPLRLSSFGHRNKALLNALKAEFGTLKTAVLAAGEHRLRFVDRTIGREAIAPPAIADALHLKMQEDTATQRRAASLFDALPLSVRLVFCVRLDEGELMALDTARPFRYSKITAPDLMRSTQRLVPARYRHPGVSPSQASLDEREALWRSFVAWAEEAGVDPGIFQQRDATTALARLIAAQPADLIPRLIIPGDIAAILLKHG